MTSAICSRCGEKSGEPTVGGLCLSCQRLVNVPAPASVSPPNPLPRQDGLAAHDNTNEWHSDDPDNKSSANNQWEIGGLLSPPEAEGELGRLGGYRILDILGGGGMGIVFRALDPVLNRHVAIKAMRPSVAIDPVNRHRFLREVRATAAHKHEHIIIIHHAGEERGIPYMVMELLEGESLELRLQRTGRLPIDEIVRIGAEIAEGLAAAHEKDLVHRDIKPGNIWLEGQRGRVRILDFGLACALTEDVQLTRPGTILGTPAFMSPEQARGGPIDARSDLFNLGAILYKLSTGKPPFTGENSYAVLTALAMETPRSIYEENAEVPPALVNLVTALLAKHPDDRPASARAVATAIEEIRRDMIRGDILGLDEVTPGLLDSASPAEAAEDDATTDEGPDDEPAKPRPLPAKVEELVGCTLSRYEIRSLLARGQHGLIFRARNQDNGQLAALKVLALDFPRNDREIQQFSKAMSVVVQHPNIVSVHAAGKTGKFCWIAMEFVEGDNLEYARKRWNEAGDAGWRRAFRVAVDIGQALLAMRQRRIIHGNVTPRNILIREADKTAKLNDLMLQKALKNSALYQRVLDQKLAEEVYYLSAEQVDSERTFVDHVCDVYGLGAVVYYALTGRPPFQGKSFEATLDLIRHGDPESPRKFNKSIPKEFEKTVLRMLAKNQEDRFQGPDELLADLRMIARRHDIPE